MSLYDPELVKTETSFLGTEKNIATNHSHIQIQQTYNQLFYEHMQNQPQEIQKRSPHLPRNKRRQKSINAILVQKLIKSKDVDILSKFSPNIGSLGQFLIPDQRQRLLFANKKQLYNQLRKRIQISNEQLKLKAFIKQNNKENQILRSSQCNIVQKKIAAKVIVQRSFQDMYDCSLEELCNSQIKLENKNKNKINLVALTKVLDDYQTNPGTKSIILRQQQLKKIMELGQWRPLVRKRKKSVYLKIDEQTKLKIVNQFKSKYIELRQVEMPQHHQQFDEAFQLFNDNSESKGYRQLNQYRKSINTGPLITQPDKQFQKKFQKIYDCKKKQTELIVSIQSEFKINQKQTNLKIIEIKSLKIGLYFINQVKFQKLKIVKLQNLRIPEEILFLFIDCLSQFSSKTNCFQEVSFCSISIDNINKFSQKIVLMLKQIKIKSLNLNYLDLGTPQFCKICIGVSSNSSLKQLNIRHNRLDGFSIKSIQMISKINENLIIDIRNNQIPKFLNTKIKLIKNIFI